MDKYTDISKRYEEMRNRIMQVDDNAVFSGRDYKKMALEMLDLAEFNLKFAKDNERILDKVIESTKKGGEIDGQ